jgi:hypothetical protein
MIYYVGHERISSRAGVVQAIHSEGYFLGQARDVAAMERAMAREERATFRRQARHPGYQHSQARPGVRIQGHMHSACPRVIVEEYLLLHDEEPSPAAIEGQLLHQGWACRPACRHQP